MKCATCHKDYQINCDYNQGRCNLHPTLVNIEQLFNKLKRLIPRWWNW